MGPHPNTILTFAELHRQDLMATHARERRAAGVSGPAIEWRSRAARVAALVALCLGMRG